MFGERNVQFVITKNLGEDDDDFVFSNEENVP